MKLLPYYFIVIDNIEYEKDILKEIPEKEASEEEEETTEQEGKQTENNRKTNVPWSKLRENVWSLGCKNQVKPNVKNLFQHSLCIPRSN